MKQSIIRNDVYVQDQFTEIIDLKLNKKIDSIILQDNYNIDDTVIRVETTGIVPTINNTICLKDINGTAFMQSGIYSVTLVSGNIYDIELNTPLDFPFTIEDGCALTTTNLAVDGSITPQIFTVGPGGLAPGVEWDIIRIMFGMAGTGVGVNNDKPDDTNFGITNALNKGLVLRTIDGIIKNIFTVRTNGGLRQRCGGDVIYVPANKNGEYAVHARRTFNGQEKNGVTIRMSSETNDELQVIIQDDLTEMSVFEIIVQGHIVQK